MSSQSIMAAAAATFAARDFIVDKIGTAVPGVDLVEILAYAILNNGSDEYSLAEVQDLIVTVAKQRLAAKAS